MRPTCQSCRKILPPAACTALVTPRPSLNLLVRPYAGRVRITDPHRRNGGRFRDNQARRGSLNVIVPHQVVWDTTGVRPATRQGGHQDAVWERDFTEAKGLEEFGQETAPLGAAGIEASRALRAHRRSLATLPSRNKLSELIMRDDLTRSPKSPRLLTKFAPCGAD